MRSFIGVPIPEEMKVKIIEIQKKFRDLDIKLVEKENLHFNFKFLGEISEETTKKIRESLESLAELFESFEIKIEGLGVFPSKNYIRVIWLGVKEGFQEMLALAESIEQSLSVLGIEKEKYGFQPHLTLGRVRTARDKKTLVEIVERYQDFEIGSMKVDKIVFFESVLTRKGPVYREIFHVTLK